MLISSSVLQMAVGWWLLLSLILVSTYKSSLIAHLTVQARSQPINTLQDLVNQKHLKWGIESWLLRGASLNYFLRHTDPVVQLFFKQVEVIFK